jgi:hypothetical protein
MGNNKNMFGICVYKIMTKIFQANFNPGEYFFGYISGNRASKLYNSCVYPPIINNVLLGVETGILNKGCSEAEI